MGLGRFVRFFFIYIFLHYRCRWVFVAAIAEVKVKEKGCGVGRPAVMTMPHGRSSIFFLVTNTRIHSETGDWFHGKLHVGSNMRGIVTRKTVRPIELKDEFTRTNIIIIIIIINNLSL